jgi:hypothetical protein
VVGEIACGSLADRPTILELLQDLTNPVRMAAIVRLSARAFLHAR